MNEGRFSLVLPTRAAVLSVSVSPSGTPTIYVEEGNDKRVTDRNDTRFFLLVQGEGPVDDFDGLYIGTFYSGAATIHLYELNA